MKTHEHQPTPQDQDPRNTNTTATTTVPITTTTMTWLLALQIPGLLLLTWLFTAYMTATSFPTLRNQRICLLIAHPDDEAMFFSPTLLHLTSPDLGNRIFILCLSTGDADGLGPIRKRELLRSASLLGIENAKDQVVVIDDAEKFPDSMTANWDPRAVSNVLVHYFVPPSNSTTAAATSPPQTNIDVLLTFDSQGVSSHPNHRACWSGALHFLSHITSRNPGWESPVKLYTLGTTTVWRKYSSFLDAPLTVLGCLLRRREGGGFPSPLVMVSGPQGVRRAQRAMTEAHVSQMRWFRWGWIGVSRYLVVNDLRKVGKGA